MKTILSIVKHSGLKHYVCLILVLSLLSGGAEFVSISLVAHLEEIRNDILAWWYSPAVQIARLNFLKLNCNKDLTIVDFLTSIANNAS